MHGFLNRNNPLKPQELDLGKSNKITYRFLLYLKRQWTQAEKPRRREVYSFAGANMAFLRQAVNDAGLFDERFSFGGEELDLCMRLGKRFTDCRLVFDSEVRVIHNFEYSIYDTLRRSRAYGRGSARLYRKWQSVPLTFFPGPLVVLAILLLATRLLATRRPKLAVAATVMPQLLYPQGLRYAIKSRFAASLLDPYVQIAQETCGNIGFLEGMWRFRHFIAKTDTD